MQSCYVVYYSYYIHVPSLYVPTGLNLSKAETRTVLRRMSSVVGGPVDKDNFFYALNIDFSSQPELRKTMGKLKGSQCLVKTLLLIFIRMYDYVIVVLPSYCLSFMISSLCFRRNAIIVYHIMIYLLLVIIIIFKFPIQYLYFSYIKLYHIYN